MISRIIEWCARNRFLVFTECLAAGTGRDLVAAAIFRSTRCRTSPTCR